MIQDCRALSLAVVHPFFFADTLTLRRVETTFLFFARFFEVAVFFYVGEYSGAFACLGKATQRLFEGFIFAYINSIHCFSPPLNRKKMSATTRFQIYVVVIEKATVSVNKSATICSSNLQRCYLQQEGL